jgi:putative ABC transport system ATP-binding protein
VLELREVVKHFPTVGREPVRAVDGVSIDIAAGEFVALYGPSGSGKTTLLLVVAALLQPDAGSIRFDGREISSLSARAAARYRMHDVGIVRQNVQLVPGLSALDNAALKLAGGGKRVREAEREVFPLLERLGLEDRLRNRPDELSMGERQRVLIARALSTGPRLVLADEPTGSLDSNRSRHVLALLQEVCHEHAAALLLVTHDPQAAGFADTVHALHDGRLVHHEPDPEMTSPVGI